jgi:guanylate kinase
METLVGKQKQGLAFILSAPAGTGKTTLVEKLTEEFADVIKNVSYTTRSPRANETDGVDYHFVSKEEFAKKIANDEFLEYVTLYGYYYGTSRSWIREKLSRGNDVFMVIDTQGAMNIKKNMGDRFPAVFIFVMPPSEEALRRRLEKRSTDTQEMIDTRLSIAAKEMAAANNYEYIIVNDDLETAYQILRSIVIAEEHRVLPRRH